MVEITVRPPTEGELDATQDVVQHGLAVGVHACVVQVQHVKRGVGAVEDSRRAREPRRRARDKEGRQRRVPALCFAAEAKVIAQPIDQRRKVECGPVQRDGYDGAVAHQCVLVQIQVGKQCHECAEPQGNGLEPLDNGTAR